MGSPREVLLGRIAVKRGLLAPEELARAIEEQTRRGNVPLGALLVQLGLLSQQQLDQLLAEQRAALQSPAQAAPGDAPPPTQGENLLGRRAVAAGLLTADQLKECIREQGLREGQGRFQRLGEILVEKGLLTATQVEALLGAQGKRLLKCPRCHAQYNVAGFGPAPACPRCKVQLVAAAAPPPSPTASTIVLPPAPSPAAPPKVDLTNISAEGTFIYTPQVDPSKETVELPAVDAGPRRAVPPPPPPARGPSGGTTKRRKKHAPKPKYVDYHKSRTARPPSFQWIGFAAVGAALLVAVLYLRGSSNPATPSPRKAEEPSTEPSSSGGPREVSDDQWRSYLADLPDDPVERLRRLEGTDLAGPLGRRARAEVSRIEEELRASLREQFSRRQQAASECAARGDFEGAIAAWRDFPVRLDVRNEFTGRVADELAALRKRESDRTLAPRPPQPVGPFPPRVP